MYCRFILYCLISIVIGKNSSEIIRHYIGCYQYFSGNNTYDEEVTVMSCIESCKISESTFAAIKNGNQCYCGSHFENSTNESGCKVECKNSPSEMCGGKHDYSVYSICLIGFYGENCDHPCKKCRNSVPCIKNNGECFLKKCLTESSDKNCDLDRTFNGVNVAMNRRAFQSSDYFTNISYPASLAVDGNKNSNFHEGNTCTHTLDTENPWFYVDLGEMKVIKKVVITNRIDHKQRLQDAQVFLSNNLPSEGIEKNLCGTVTENLIERIELHCQMFPAKRYLIVIIPRDEFLTLCEIEAYTHDCAESKVCKDNEECVNIFGHNRCACKSGYYKEDIYSQCSDEDECMTNRHNCNATSSICVNNVGGFSCSCKDGYSHFDNHTCIDYDECYGFNECDFISTTCDNTHGSYYCECKTGFERCNFTLCSDIDECALNNDNCDNQTTTCKNINGGYQCTCNDGYEIKNDSNSTCEDVDECTLNNDCDNQTTTCKNINGGYHCTCKDGYAAKNDSNSTCGDINECETLIITPLSTECINTIGSYEILCKMGFKKQDNTCEDIDECLETEKYDPMVTCTNSIGGFKCSCSDGLYLHEKSDKYACKEHINVGKIVAILMTVIILIILGICVAYIWKRKQKKNHRDEIPEKKQTMIDSSKYLDDKEITYENLNKEHSKTRIRIDDLSQYIRTISEQDCSGFEKEFMAIPKTFGYSTNYAQEPNLKSKNRFQNIFPYDNTRVVLSGTNENFSDYINASHITGFENTVPLIAAQGPRDQTVNDFWRMIMEQNVNSIVMLTQLIENNKNKCVLYWPEQKDEMMEFGNISVINLSKVVYEKFVRREFEIIKKDNVETSKVTQWQYLGWPDHGVPTDVQSFLRFRNNVRAWMDGGGKTLVHCSAGVGRTGCFIAIDVLLEEAAIRGSVDVVSCVTELRHQRPHMVQTAVQYDFIYLALKLAFEEHISYIPISTFHKKYLEMCNIGLDGRSKMEKEFEMLFQQISSYPYESSVIDVTKQSVNDQWKSYWADGVWMPNKYIFSRFPTGEDIEKFWEICMQHCGVVLIMDYVKDNLSFLPNDTKSLVWKEFTLSVLSSTQIGNLHLQSISIHSQIQNIYENTISINTDEPLKTIGLIRINVENKEYLSKDIFATIETHLKKYSAANSSSSIFILNRDDIKLGLFYVSCCLIFDQMEAYKEVNICQTVLDLHKEMSGPIITLAQYKNLYEIVEKKLNTKIPD